MIKVEANKSGVRAETEGSLLVLTSETVRIVISVYKNIQKQTPKGATVFKQTVTELLQDDGMWEEKAIEVEE